MLRWIGLAAASCVVMVRRTCSFPPRFLFLSLMFASLLQCSDVAVAKRGNKKKWKDKERKDDEYYKFKKKERKKRKKAIGVEGEVCA